MRIQSYLSKKGELVFSKLLNIFEVTTENRYHDLKELFERMGEELDLDRASSPDGLVEQFKAKVSPQEETEMLEERELKGLLKARERGSYEENLEEERVRRGLKKPSENVVRLEKRQRFKTVTCACGHTYKLRESLVLSNCPKCGIDRSFIINVEHDQE